MGIIQIGGNLFCAVDFQRQMLARNALIGTSALKQRVVQEEILADIFFAAGRSQTLFDVRFDLGIGFFTNALKHR